jgi:hypothetical protein
MNWKGFGRKRSWLTWSYYPGGIHLEELRKPTNILNHYSQFPVQDRTQHLPNVSETLSIEPACSVSSVSRGLCSWDSSWGVVIRERLSISQFDSPQGHRFSLLSVWFGPWAFPASYPLGTGVCFPWGGRESDRSPPSSPDNKNAWCFVSIHPIHGA